MRINDILSNEIDAKFEQVENFVGNRSLPMGKSKKVDSGKVALNFLCKECGDIRTFVSTSDLHLVPINEGIVSIDCRLQCVTCDECIPVWFLVEIDGDITSVAPKARLLKRLIKYSDKVKPKTDNYGGYTELLYKAECAYREGLGAGAIVYLRKVFESVIFRVASSYGINIYKPNQKTKPFKEILETVKAQTDVIPQEFAEDGYRLFGELSDVVHGEYDENTGLQKYQSLRRLVIGVLDNVKNKQEFIEARNNLGWNEQRAES